MTITGATLVATAGTYCVEEAGESQWVRSGIQYVNQKSFHDYVNGAMAKCGM